MSEAEDLVTGYVKLWPRDVFYIEDSECVSELREKLNHPGVYILYHDFDVFYVGQSECLFKRLSEHATKRYRLWNHFSAFLVPKKGHLDYMEAIMIAAMPRTANMKPGKGINRLKISLPRVVDDELSRHRLFR